MIGLAKAISNIFNPVIVAPGAFAILINQASNPGSNRMIIWLIVLFFATIVPIVAMLWLKKKGAITDLDVSLREQRFIPLLIGIFSYGAAYLILEWLNADNITKGLVFCSLTNIIIVTVITRYWKISIHAAGLTGPLAALVGSLEFLCFPHGSPGCSGGHFPCDTKSSYTNPGYSRFNIWFRLYDCPIKIIFYLAPCSTFGR